MSQSWPAATPPVEPGLDLRQPAAAVPDCLARVAIGQR